MMFKTGVKFAAALMGVAGMTLAVGILPAVGQASVPVAGIKLKAPGLVADRGAVVFESVLIACPAGDEPNVSIEITERSGNAIAQGDAGVNPVCTGGIQTVSLAVTPVNKPFVVGTAFAQAEIFDCGPFGCAQATSQGNLKLKLKAK